MPVEWPPLNRRMLRPHAAANEPSTSVSRPLALQRWPEAVDVARVVLAEQAGRLRSGGLVVGAHGDQGVAGALERLGRGVGILEPVEDGDHAAGGEVRHDARRTGAAVVILDGPYRRIVSAHPVLPFARSIHSATCLYGRLAPMPQRDTP